MARHFVTRQAHRLVAALLVLLPATLAPAAPATADERTIGLYVATFLGTGVVKMVDGEDQARINVDTYNAMIGADECSAVAYLGGVPGVVTCRFSYNATYIPFAKGSCSGIATGTGIFALEGAHPRTYRYPTMRALVDDGTVHAVAHEVVDPDTGQTRPGFASFEFAAPCGTTGTNTGRSGY